MTHWISISVSKEKRVLEFIKKVWCYDIFNVRHFLSYAFPFLCYFWYYVCNFTLIWKNLTKYYFTIRCDRRIFIYGIKWYNYHRTRQNYFKFCVVDNNGLIFVLFPHQPNDTRIKFSGVHGVLKYLEDNWWPMIINICQITREKQDWN